MTRLSFYLIGVSASFLFSLLCFAEPQMQRQTDLESLSQSLYEETQDLYSSASIDAWGGDTNQQRALERIDDLLGDISRLKAAIRIEPNDPAKSFKEFQNVQGTMFWVEGDLQMANFSFGTMTEYEDVEAVYNDLLREYGFQP